MAMVDTTSSGLSLYVALSASAFEDFSQTEVVKPDLVMKPEAGRAWIPLHVSYEDALHRAIWGAEERGEIGLCPKSDFYILQITITAHGFGYFYLKNTLTTRDWTKWRFHGEFSLRGYVSEKNEVLLTVSNVLRIQ